MPVGCVFPSVDDLGTCPYMCRKEGGACVWPWPGAAYALLFLFFPPLFSLPLSARAHTRALPCKMPPLPGELIGPWPRGRCPFPLVGQMSHTTAPMLVFTLLTPLDGPPPSTLCGRQQNTRNVLVLLLGKKNDPLVHRRIHTKPSAHAHICPHLET